MNARMKFAASAVASILSTMGLAFTVGVVVGIESATPGPGKYTAGIPQDAPCLEDEAYVVAPDFDGKPTEGLLWECRNIDDLEVLS